jgi:2'-5' RNA ligase
VGRQKAARRPSVGRSLGNHDVRNRETFVSESIRCFIAVKIPGFDPLRRIIQDLGNMGRALKAVDADNLHVTLKFLGNTTVELVDNIRAELEAATRCRRPSGLTVVGLGAFPHAQRPNVVWAGFEGDGVETLAGLAGDLESRLERLGFASENRPFVPHLTLARVKAKPPESLEKLLLRNAKTPFGATTIEHVELIRSELGPDGPRYTVLATSRLSG